MIKHLICGLWLAEEKGLALVRESMSYLSLLFLCCKIFNLHQYVFCECMYVSFTNMLWMVYLVDSISMSNVLIEQSPLLVPLKYPTTAQTMPCGMVYYCQ